MPHDVAALLAHARELADKFDHANAAKFLERAVEQDPTHVDALDALAAARLEQGDGAGAYECIRRSIDLAPDVGYKKYMLMGQLCQGDDALQCFTRGVQMMYAHEETATASGADAEAALKRDLVAGLCQVAELYMTDLCMEENAEETCGQCLQKALEIQPDNAETLLSYASFCISAQNDSAAEQALRQSLALWLPAEPEAIDQAQDGEIVHQEMVVTAEQRAHMPTFEIRVNAARVSIEMEMYPEAMRILELLAHEDDEVVDVWYLYGWVYTLMENDVDAARECLERAATLHKRLGNTDADMIAHIKELLDQMPPPADHE